jgi:tetratricopeptide (TPR) repeat protein
VLRGITMTAGMPNSIPDALADLRILTVEYRNQSTWYQLAYDRLIEAVKYAKKPWHPDHDNLSVDPATALATAGLRAEAEAAFATGDFMGAERLIAAALESYRAAKDTRGLAYTLELQGEVALVKADLKAAERSFRDALYEFSSLSDAAAQARILSTLGDLSGAVGDYTRAVQYHQQANECLPANVEALTGLGYAQWHWGSPADAEATFSRALGWNRNNGNALAGRGQVRVELRAFPGALSDLDRAITLGLPPDKEIDARSARAVVLANLGREEEADHEIRAARFPDPDRPLTQLRAGRVAAFLGQTERARDDLEHALRAQPPLPPGDARVARRLLKKLNQISD